jgi:hypothetical protein
MAFGRVQWRLDFSQPEVEKGIGAGIETGKCAKNACNRVYVTDTNDLWYKLLKEIETYHFGNMKSLGKDPRQETWVLQREAVSGPWATTAKAYFEPPFFWEWGVSLLFSKIAKELTRDLNKIALFLN